MFSLNTIELFLEVCISLSVWPYSEDFLIINIDDDILDTIIRYNISWEKLKYWISDLLVFSNFDSRDIFFFGSPNGTFRWRNWKQAVSSLRFYCLMLENHSNK